MAAVVTTWGCVRGHHAGLLVVGSSRRSCHLVAALVGVCLPCKVKVSPPRLPLPLPCGGVWCAVLASSSSSCG